MRGSLATFCVVLLVVLSGCVTPFGEFGTTPPNGETPTAGAPVDGTATETHGGTAVDQPTQTATDPSDLSADNPFGQKIVPVRVNDTVADGRDSTALVARAIDYWNERIDRYTAFDYRFTLAEDPGDARVEVRYVEEIAECGRDRDDRTVGCAPLLEEGRTAPPVAVARIEVHGSNSAVLGTIQHELGHILGLRHDDEPLTVMGYLTDQPVTNATDRAVPWFTNDLSVYVDHESLDGDRTRIDAQIDHALSYYDDGADGTVPTNVSFTRTDHEASADVVIGNADRFDCGGVSNGVRWAIKGSNIDTDGAMEVYTRQVICIDVDEDAFGWYVGNALGFGMGLEDSELAPPFQNAGPRERRSDWWE